MDNTLDIDVLPVNRQGGYDLSELPGLHLAVPPRRSARGRADDLLVMYTAMKGNAPFSPNQQSELLEDLSKTYYRTSGSVTSALRVVVELLNQFLLDHNLQSRDSGLQTIGLLTLVAVRGSVVYLAQSGPIHAFVLAERDSQHLYDTQIAGRGLGISSTPKIRFSHTSMEIGGLLVISPAPPPTWTIPTLKSIPDLSPEVLYQHLVGRSGPDLAAVILIALPGRGELNLLQRAPARPQTITAPGAPAQPPVETPPSPAAPAPDRPDLAAPPESLIAAPTLASSAEPAAIGEITQPPAGQPVAEASAPTDSVPQDTPQPALDAAQPPGGVSVAPIPAEAEQVKSAVPKVKKPRRFALGAMLLSLSDALARTWRRFTEWARTLLGRMLPGEGIFTIPSSVMALIAITVPLVVVVVASVVYFERGRAAQYQANYTEAQNAAQQTIGKEDPSEVRAAWETSLFYLDKAEEYQITPESQALRALAQQSLDNLNGVTRLNFLPAIVGGLANTSNITQIAATQDELYLLDNVEGAVKRAILTARGYELDREFQCGPGSFGGYVVGPLIDIAPLPKGNELNATLLAMDSNGNLLYCIPGELPLSTPLTPPDSNWGQPIALTLDSGNLYVLDPQTNAVWVYQGTNGSFRDRPNLFFSADIPPMKDVVDLAVNRQDLYLLHSDGHLTTCVYSDLPEAPTRCTDPATFSDPRPGRTDGPLIPDALFTQIQFAQPPDPSLYLLDPNTQSIYHTSLRLTLQRLFGSASPLPDEPATSFAISPNRTAFLAFGDQVVYASFP